MKSSEEQRTGGGKPRSRCVVLGGTSSRRVASGCQLSVAAVEPSRRSSVVPSSGSDSGAYGGVDSRCAAQNSPTPSAETAQISTGSVSPANSAVRNSTSETSTLVVVSAAGIGGRRIALAAEAWWRWGAEVDRVWCRFKISR